MPRHICEKPVLCVQGVVAHIFNVKLGVADVQLIDYLSDLLLRFQRMDAPYSGQAVRGLLCQWIIGLQRQAVLRIGLAQRAAFQNVGDFALFWVGVYPEAVEREAEYSPLTIGDYWNIGRQSYRQASSIDAPGVAPSPDLFQQLADDFDCCAYGLGYFRQEMAES